MIPWFSKTEGNTYATLLHHPFLFKGKPTHAQEVARRISGAVAGEAYAKSSQDLLSRQQAISGAVAGEAYAKVNIPSTPTSPLPLVFLSPTSPLPFYSPSLSLCLLFARVLVCLLVVMAQDATKLCDFTNTNNNDFLSTPIAPLANTESCEINTALLNLVMKDQFAGLPSEDVATHLNGFVDLCDMQK